MNYNDTITFRLKEIDNQLYKRVSTKLKRGYMKSIFLMEVFSAGE